MAVHTKEQRAFIVLRLARFDSATEIIAAFCAKWKDTTCDVLDVAACDPQRGAIIDPELWEQFKAERARILADPGTAPTSDKNVRLRWLHRAADLARNNNQVALMAELLAQIADEQGASGDTPAGGELPIVSITRRVVYPEPVKA